MTTTVNEEIMTVVAAEALTAANAKYKVVSIGGTITPTILLAAGLLKTSVKSGDHAGVVYEGITKGWAAAAVTSGGVELTVTTSGWLTAAASGDRTCGRALEPASSGDLFRCLVDFANIGYKPT